MGVNDTDEVKAYIGGVVHEMRQTEGYKEMMKRIDERCGKFFNRWVIESEEGAKVIRDAARGYYSFNKLADEIIHEGEVARAKLKGTIQSSPR